MGNAAAVVKMLSCGDCARYVCNAMTLHSRCSGCCELDLETQEVALPDADSDMSMSVEGCCHIHG